MKQFNYALGTLVLALMIGFSSCEKSPDVKDTAEVSFVFDVQTDLIKKDGSEIVNGLDIVCIDGAIPVTVDVTINGNDYSLDVLQNFEGGNQTTVLQLPAAVDHVLSKFLVKDAGGNVIYATPENGSRYQAAYGMDGVALTFETEAFKKKKVTVPVLCFQDFYAKDFGFNWFEFEKYKTKTVCFFGDICTELYEEWHTYAGSVANPYAAQDYDGYDFPAIFRVEMTNGVWTTSTSNLDVLGEGNVCAEYLDDLQVDDEVFDASIYLLLPDGSEALLGVVPVSEDEWSDAGNNSWGDEYGVFTFSVGNCGNSRTTYSVPDFSRVWMNIKGDYTGSPSYVDILFKVEGLTPYAEVVDGALLDGWCAKKDWFISYNTWYEINLYSSLNTAPMPDYMDVINFDALNYIANHLGQLVNDYGKTKVQDAIWHYTNGYPANNAVAEIEANYPSFNPMLGDYIFVVCDPIGNAASEIQFMMVKNPNE